MSLAAQPEPVAALAIPRYEEREAPTKHVAYEVVLRGPVRSWSVWRRYSEFEALHRELVALYPDHPPPQQLPAKSLALSTALATLGLGLAADPAKIEARRAGLEQYLLSLLKARDARWRRSIAWQQFLAIPESLRPAALASAPASGSASQRQPAAGSDASPAASDLTARLADMSARPAGGSIGADVWIDDLRQLQALVTDIKAELNARARAAETGNVALAQSKSAHLRKAVGVAAERLNALDTALLAAEAALRSSPQGAPQPGRDPTTHTSKGEVRRRQDLLANLKEDVAQVTKAAWSTPAAPQRAARESAERQQLMGTQSLTARPGAAAARSSRKFGNTTLPEETEETRPLDNEGLLQLQRATLDQQETELDSLASIIQRQRQIGLQIGQELDLQNQLLEELDTSVGRVETHLKTSDKKLGRLLGK
ncbi:hypothetical protein HK105_204012 [Polyrhizophydium stewartii]|uniref:Syntaxin n=1 Tax=Polyrhizophydium stewartii TaxID=2732419 RepID=A0ABR4NAV8_9FUNG|nr:hypothetical protein HK105_002398 [Polyrhizophydium stewartii]